MDGIGALTVTQQEYGEGIIIGFIETWLQEHIPDSNSTISGF